MLDTTEKVVVPFARQTVWYVSTFIGDDILVTAAPDEIPEPLIEQLAVGGRMVIPVGDFYQQLTVVEKTDQGISKRVVFPVRFVPMTGEATR